jgi:hypothetical protein
MDIKEIKKEEIQEIIDFYYFIQDFGHIFHFESKLLDSPFRKIIEGMDEVRDLVEKSYSI